MTLKTEQKSRKMTSSTNLRKGSAAIDKLCEMIKQDFKTFSKRPKEQNIKCCQIFGSVAGSVGGGSKLRLFGHACAVYAPSTFCGCRKSQD